MDQLAAGVEKRHVIQLGSKKLTIVVGSTPTFNAYSDGKPMRIGESEKQAFTPTLSRRFANRPSHSLCQQEFFLTCDLPSMSSWHYNTLLGASRRALSRVRGFTQHGHPVAPAAAAGPCPPRLR